MAGTDLVIIAILILVQVFITFIGWKTGLGVMYLAAGMLGLFGLGEVFANQPVNFQDGGANYTLQPISVDMVIGMQAIMTIVSFIFIFYERYNTE